MSTISIPDLWPDNIRVTVLEPIAILRAQVTALNKRTQGLLRAEIRSYEQKETTTDQTRRIIYDFDLVATALNSYRITLLRVIHSVEFIYPVLVQSRVFDPNHKHRKLEAPTIGVPKLPESFAQVLALPIQPDPEYREAATQDDFVSLVGTVLQSAWVRSLIESLIAQSNAQAKRQDAPGPQSAEPPERTAP